MTFQRSIFARILISLVLIGMSLFTVLYINNAIIKYLISIISFTIILFITGLKFKVENDKLSKYFFCFKVLDVDIKEIEVIEYYTERRVGQIQITIFNPKSDEYRLIFNGRENLKIASYYLNGRMGIGEYLCNHYKINKREIERVKYIYGNP